MRNDYLDYLMHYGVKGMKWGIRRDRNESNASLSDSAKKTMKNLETKKKIKNGTRQLLDKIKKVKESKTPEEKKDAEKKAEEKAKESIKKGQDWWTQNIKVGKDKPKVSSAERVVGTTEKGIKTLVDLRNLRDSHSVNKKAMKEMASLTNDELRDIVTKAKERRALEDDYMKYVASGVSRGRERTTETLESLGTLVSFAGSVVTIASVVKSIGNVVNGKDDD